MGRDVTDQLLRKSITDTLAQQVSMKPNELFHHQTINNMNFESMRQIKNLADVVNSPDIRQQFIFIYNERTKSSGGAYFYDRESNFLKNLIMNSDYIAKAPPIGFAMAMLNLAYYGLSIEPIAKALAYFVPRNKGVVYEISPYGELALRKQSGAIKDIEGPHIVYQGDLIEITDGRVKHTAKMKSEKITGAWMRIIKPDGVIDDKYFSMEQIQKYRSFSNAQNSIGWIGGVEHEGVKQPTRGMIEGKVIKHGLSTYPRLNLKPGVALSEEDFSAEQAADAAYANAVAQLSHPTGEDYETEHDEQREQSADTQEQQPEAQDSKPEIVQQVEKKADEIPTFTF